MSDFDSPRAQRRHHMARLKAVRKRYMVMLGVKSPRGLGRLLHTPKLCSCHMCGNPRKYFGQRTRQEHKFDLDFSV